MSDDFKDKLKRHCAACSLLGEAQGIMNGMLWSVAFQSDEHKELAESAITRFGKKVDEFVNMGMSDD